MNAFIFKIAGPDSSQNFMKIKFKIVFPNQLTMFAGKL